MDRGGGFLVSALSPNVRSAIASILVFLTILGCSSGDFQRRSEKEEVVSQRGKICVLAIGKLDLTPLEKLAADLEKILEQEVEFSRTSLDLEFAYDQERKQYHSSAILKKLPALSPEACGRTLAILDVDLYVPDLNFVFGEADVLTRMAVIATKRLRPEFYGLAEDERLLHERTLKESVHELGHTYGLAHCVDKKCVMHFSNSLGDTDFKSASFCRACRDNLLSVINLEGREI